MLVLPPRRKACKPWVTTFIDDATRAIAGWAIADTPHEGTVLAALARAIMHDASGPVHGLPGRIRLDRGLEFAAKGVQSAAATFVVDLHVLPAFASNLKGKVERSNLTIDQMYSSTLPGYTKGRRDLSGRLSGPLDDRSTARAAYEEAAAAGADPGELPMSWKTFVEHFSDWVRWYNTEHLHSRLQGLTPTEAWNADPTAVRDVSPEDVRHLFRYGGTRIVNNDGIHFDNGVFTCPEGLLREIGGVTVEVRFMPHEDRYIDVYRHGSFLTRCYLVDKLTEQQRDDYYRSVRESDRKAAAVKRSVTARTRRRLAVMSRPDDPVEEARRIQPADMAATQRQNSAASAQRSRPREWSTSLLGIGPVSAVEEPSAELDTLLSEPGSPAFAIDEPPVVLDDILTDPPGGGYLAGEEDSW
ncbi:hypothetical protein J2S41_002779 [Catenuloplanes atrovinosus]|uniref:Integrase catalytic domain-containing protein n=1 Tax=Catenuloplanes atrovinosus TaxID=137266 RepID=A0AAE3YP58_9ACTN|nr:hypothetical protein [Catenuloplanes atrovinosus]